MFLIAHYWLLCRDFETIGYFRKFVKMCKNGDSVIFLLLITYFYLIPTGISERPIQP